MLPLTRTQASRLNGSLSRGPQTPAGKLRSSRNAIRHGLTSQCIVLPTESAGNFQALLDQHLQRFAPVDDVEMGMIEEMAASYWRMRRAWAIETRMLEAGLESQAPGNEIVRLAAAFNDLAAAPQLGLLHRYEARLHLMYQRALHNLVLLRHPALQNEPEPPEDTLVLAGIDLRPEHALQNEPEPSRSPPVTGMQDEVESSAGPELHPASVPRTYPCSTGQSAAPNMPVRRSAIPPPFPRFDTPSAPPLS